MTMPRPLFAVCLILSVFIAQPAGADNPWISALAEDFTVLGFSQGDLDGDGTREKAVCYRDPEDTGRSMGGLVIFSGEGPQVRHRFHVRLDRTVCEKVTISKRTLTMELHTRLSGRLEKKRLVWTLGKDFDFAGGKRHPLAGMTVEATSSPRGGRHRAQAAVDGSLSSSWAEGKDGTGVGEELSLSWKKPVHIGLVGIFGGSSLDRREFEADNRLHRASLEIQTESDVGDVEADLNFADLGIDIMGDRQEFELENEARPVYIEVNKKDARGLSLRIESVYLGGRTDDTHVAEVEIVPVIDIRQTLDQATAIKAAPTKGAEKPSEKPSKTTAPQAKTKKSQGDPVLDALDAEPSIFGGD
jgi:hypothetical protein